MIPEEKDANITYDETVYTVEITVELDDEENPTAYVITEQTITKGEEEVTSIEFANEYTNKTPNKTPDNTDKTVKTGDDTNILLSLILVGGSLVTIVACAFSRRRARR